jgi:hypothetical protein
LISFFINYLSAFLKFLLYIKLFWLIFISIYRDNYRILNRAENLKNTKTTEKNALNAQITREPLGYNFIKILPIPIFIDNYNHYIGGID